MTQAEFISQLKSSLGKISESEKNEICDDYLEHFRIGLAEGKREEQIAQALGNPRVIGHSYHLNTLLDRENKGGITGVSVLRAIFASISLSLFNVIFVLGPFLVLVGILFALWMVAGALMLSGLCISLSPLSPQVPPLIATAWLNAMFLFFSGLGVAALGLLTVLGMIKVTQGFYLATAGYLRFNARVILGEK